ncbi:SH3 domain-binding protein 2 [Corythoichthys intestinalis]|uniref:SH3 domain-binding protein 2 n=1 Tax=Corythoichthys intestinalis TaxID=161448 RepID=UPI0025A5A7A1|nr:SH3 domain-binding protein 2 [Corythoichthys intestinalis]
MYVPSVRKSTVRSVTPRVKMCFQEQKTFITMSSLEVCWPVPMRAIGAQNLLTMPGGVCIAGYLHKKGASQFSLLRWPLRYIIIHKGCVYYFKSSTSPAPQGAFSLNGYNRVMRAAEETTSNNVFPFKMIHFSKKHRTWYFSAASEDERRRWMRSLRREIDHYNDRKESHIPSDSDSDAESFYGTIEKPMDIKHPINNADNDYVEDDDDEDEEDYLKPDGDCLPTSTGRPTGPPPSYPPPPVPAIPQQHLGSCVAIHKGLPPPVPSHCRNLTGTNPKKPLPAIPPPILKRPNKSPPPPPPFSSQLQNHPSPFPPPLPPPNSQWPPKSRTQSAVGPGTGNRRSRPPSAVSLQTPATLPICNQLETRMIVTELDHCSREDGKVPIKNHLTQTSKLRGKPSQSVTTAENFEGPVSKLQTTNHLLPTQTPSNYPPQPNHPPRSPLLQTVHQNRNTNSTKVPPSVKPPVPAPKPRHLGTLLQRTDPEGQSFRASGERSAMEFTKKRDFTTCSEGYDQDYDNMHLPDSVFIDSTETSFVEKLFKERSVLLQNGLYGIRNSGTKTSKVLVVWDVTLGKARNYRLFEEGEQVFLDCDVTFPTLSALIEHYYSHPLPHQSSLFLQMPYSG